MVRSGGVTKAPIKGPPWQGDQLEAQNRKVRTTIFMENNNGKAGRVSLLGTVAPNDMKKLSMISLKSPRARRASQMIEAQGISPTPGLQPSMPTGARQTSVSPRNRASVFAANGDFGKILAQTARQMGETDFDDVGS